MVAVLPSVWIALALAACGGGTQGADDGELLSDFKVCGDEDCSMWLYKVEAVLDFAAPDCHYVSFRAGDVLYVYHTLAGRRDDLWAGSAGVQFGYFPKNYVKVIYKEPSAKEFKKPTQFTDFMCLPSSNQKAKKSDDESQGNDVIHSSDVEPTLQKVEGTHSEKQTPKIPSEKDYISKQDPVSEDARIEEDRNVKSPEGDGRLVTPQGQSSNVTGHGKPLLATASHSEANHEKSHDDSVAASKSEVDANLFKAENPESGQGALNAESQREAAVISNSHVSQKDVNVLETKEDDLVTIETYKDEMTPEDNVSSDLPELQILLTEQVSEVSSTEQLPTELVEHDKRLTNELDVTEQVTYTMNEGEEYKDLATSDEHILTGEVKRRRASFNDSPAVAELPMTHDHEDVFLAKFNTANGEQQTLNPVPVSEEIKDEVDENIDFPKTIVETAITEGLEAGGHTTEEVSREQVSTETSPTPEDIESNDLRRPRPAGNDEAADVLPKDNGEKIASKDHERPLQNEIPLSSSSADIGKDTNTLESEDSDFIHIETYEDENINADISRNNYLPELEMRLTEQISESKPSELLDTELPDIVEGRSDGGNVTAHVTDLSADGESYEKPATWDKHIFGSDIQEKASTFKYSPEDSDDSETDAESHLGVAAKDDATSNEAAYLVKFKLTGNALNPELTRTDDGIVTKHIEPIDQNHDGDKDILTYPLREMPADHHHKSSGSNWGEAIGYGKFEGKTNDVTEVLNVSPELETNMAAEAAAKTTRHFKMKPSLQPNEEATRLKEREPQTNDTQAAGVQYDPAINKTKVISENKDVAEVLNKDQMKDGTLEIDSVVEAGGKQSGIFEQEKQTNFAEGEHELNEAKEKLMSATNEGLAGEDERLHDALISEYREIRDAKVQMDFSVNSTHLELDQGGKTVKQDLQENSDVMLNEATSQAESTEPRKKPSPQGVEEVDVNVDVNLEHAAEHPVSIKSEVVVEETGAKLPETQEMLVKPGDLVQEVDAQGEQKDIQAGNVAALSKETKERPEGRAGDLKLEEGGAGGGEASDAKKLLGETPVPRKSMTEEVAVESAEQGKDIDAGVKGKQEASGVHVEAMSRDGKKAVDIPMDESSLKSNATSENLEQNTTLEYKLEIDNIIENTTLIVDKGLGVGDKKTLESLVPVDVNKIDATSEKVEQKTSVKSNLKIDKNIEDTTFNINSRVADVTDVVVDTFERNRAEEVDLEKLNKDNVDSSVEGTIEKGHGKGSFKEINPLLKDNGDNMKPSGEDELRKSSTKETNETLTPLKEPHAQAERVSAEGNEVPKEDVTNKDDATKTDTAEQINDQVRAERLALEDAITNVNLELSKALADGDLRRKTALNRKSVAIKESGAAMDSKVKSAAAGANEDLTETKRGAETRDSLSDVLMKGSFKAVKKEDSNLLKVDLEDEILRMIDGETKTVADAIEAAVKEVGDTKVTLQENNMKKEPEMEEVETTPTKRATIVDRGLSGDDGDRNESSVRKEPSQRELREKESEVSNGRVEAGADAKGSVSKRDQAVDERHSDVKGTDSGDTEFSYSQDEEQSLINEAKSRLISELKRAMSEDDNGPVKVSSKEDSDIMDAVFKLNLEFKKALIGNSAESYKAADGQETLINPEVKIVEDVKLNEDLKEAALGPEELEKGNEDAHVLEDVSKNTDYYQDNVRKNTASLTQDDAQAVEDTGEERPKERVGVEREKQNNFVEGENEISDAKEKLMLAINEGIAREDEPHAQAESVSAEENEVPKEDLTNKDDATKTDTAEQINDQVRAERLALEDAITKVNLELSKALADGDVQRKTALDRKSVAIKESGAAMDSKVKSAAAGANEDLTETKRGAETHDGLSDVLMKGSFKAETNNDSNLLKVDLEDENLKMIDDETKTVADAIEAAVKEVGDTKVTLQENNMKKEPEMEEVETTPTTRATIVDRGLSGDDGDRNESSVRKEPSQRELREKESEVSNGRVEAGADAKGSVSKRDQAVDERHSDVKGTDSGDTELSYSQDEEQSLINEAKSRLISELKRAMSEDDNGPVKVSSKEDLDITDAVFKLNLEFKKALVGNSAESYKAADGHETLINPEVKIVEDVKLNEDLKEAALGPEELEKGNEDAHVLEDINKNTDLDQDNVRKNTASLTEDDVQAVEDTGEERPKERVRVEREKQNNFVEGENEISDAKEKLMLAINEEIAGEDERLHDVLNSKYREIRDAKTRMDSNVNKKSSELDDWGKKDVILEENSDVTRPAATEEKSGILEQEKQNKFAEGEYEINEAKEKLMLAINEGIAGEDERLNDALNSQYQEIRDAKTRMDSNVNRKHLELDQGEKNVKQELEENTYVTKPTAAKDITEGDDRDKDAVAGTPQNEDAAQEDAEIRGAATRVRLTMKRAMAVDGAVPPADLGDDAAIQKAKSHSEDAWVWEHDDADGKDSGGLGDGDANDEAEPAVMKKGRMKVRLPQRRRGAEGTEAQREGDAGRDDDPAAMEEGASENTVPAGRPTLDVKIRAHVKVERIANKSDLEMLAEEHGSENVVKSEAVADDEDDDEEPAGEEVSDQEEAVELEEKNLGGRDDLNDDDDYENYKDDLELEEEETDPEPDDEEFYEEEPEEEEEELEEVEEEEKPEEEEKKHDVPVDEKADTSSSVKVAGHHKHVGDATDDDGDIESDDPLNELDEQHHNIDDSDGHHADDNMASEMDDLSEGELLEDQNALASEVGDEVYLETGQQRTDENVSHTTTGEDEVLPDVVEQTDLGNDHNRSVKENITKDDIETLLDSDEARSDEKQQAPSGDSDSKHNGSEGLSPNPDDGLPEFERTVVEDYLSEERQSRLRRLLTETQLGALEGRLRAFERELADSKTRTEGSMEDVEKSLDSVTDRHEGSLLRWLQEELEGLAEPREEEEAEEGHEPELEDDVYEERVEVFNDVQDVVFAVRKRFSMSMESVPIAPGAKVTTVQDKFSWLPSDNSATLPDLILRLDSVFLYVRACVPPFLGSLIGMVASQLPAAWRPGPSYRGLPWDVVATGACVAAVVSLAFLWRLVCVFQNRRYLRRETRHIHTVKKVLEEKHQLAEQLANTRREIYEKASSLGDVLEGSKGSKQAITKLQTEHQELQESISERRREMETIRHSLESMQQHWEQQHSLKLQLQQSTESVEQTLGSLKEELAAVLSRVGTTNRNNHKMQAELVRLEKENKRLQRGDKQLQEEVETCDKSLGELMKSSHAEKQTQKSLEEAVAFKQSEVEAMTACLNQLKDLGVDSESLDESEKRKHKQKLQELMDVSKVDMMLKVVEEEIEDYKSLYQQEVAATHKLEETLEAFENKNTKLSAEKGNLCAELTCCKQKLHMVKQMYEEKEVKLQRRLTLEESHREQNKGKLSAVDERVLGAIEDANIHRRKVEDLREELNKTEKNYKDQISMNEKKVHENWLKARTAEREMVASKKEVSTLKERMSDIELKLALLRRAPAYRMDYHRGLPLQPLVLPARRGASTQEGSSFASSPVSGPPSPPMLTDEPRRGPPRAPGPPARPPRAADNGPSSPLDSTDGLHNPVPAGWQPERQASYGPYEPPGPAPLGVAGYGPSPAPVQYGAPAHVGPPYGLPQPPPPHAAAPASHNGVPARGPPPGTGLPAPQGPRYAPPPSHAPSGGSGHAATPGQPYPPAARAAPGAPAQGQLAPPQPRTPFDTPPFQGPCNPPPPWQGTAGQHPPQGSVGQRPPHGPAGQPPAGVGMPGQPPSQGLPSQPLNVGPAGPPLPQGSSGQRPSQGPPGQPLHLGPPTQHLSQGPLGHPGFQAPQGQPPSLRHPGPRPPQGPPGAAEPPHHRARAPLSPVLSQGPRVPPPSRAPFVPAPPWQGARGPPAPPAHGFHARPSPQEVRAPASRFPAENVRHRPPPPPPPPASSGVQSSAPYSRGK